MMEEMVSVTLEGREIDREERGEEDRGPSPGLVTGLLELKVESGHKFLAVEGVRSGEGRFCDLSDSGEGQRFMSRHFRDLGVIPLVTSSGVTLALSGVRLAVMRTELTYSERKNNLFYNIFILSPFDMYKSELTYGHLYDHLRVDTYMIPALELKIGGFKLLSTLTVAESCHNIKVGALKLPDDNIKTIFQGQSTFPEFQ